MTAKYIITKVNEFNFSRILKILSILIPAAIAGNVIYIFAASEPEILNNLTNYKLSYLFLAAVMVFMPWITNSIRTWLWSRVYGCKLSSSRALKSTIAAEIGSAATPTMVGGGYVKLFFLIKYGFTPGQATLTMLLGSLEDGVFFGIALPLALVITRAWDNEYVLKAADALLEYLPLVALGVVALLIAVLIINRLRLRKSEKASQTDYSIKAVLSRVLKKLKNYISDFFTATKFVWNNGKGTFIINAILGGIGWCGRYGAISALVIGLGYQADPILFFLLQWVVFTTMTMIPTPGAVGGAEVSFGLIYSGLIPGAVIPVITGAWRFITFYLLVGVGAIFMTIAGPGFPAGNEKRSLPEEDIEVLEKQPA
ncbi:MAG: flippase-like domain-containing protein [candidate division Zixibacteria bacterium]|nr:flippase-like domain-containing protein [candidate division Zixibacteria bacterium]